MACAIRILLLTAQRRGELALARWRDIDFEAKTFPAEEFICGAWDFAWGQLPPDVPGSNVLLEKVAPRTVARVIKALAASQAGPGRAVTMGT